MPATIAGVRVTMETGAEPRRAVIFTRFSVVTGGGFAHTPEWYQRWRKFLPKAVRSPLRKRSAPATVADKCRMLFATERLRRRFHLFETIALPSIAGQEDRRFLHVVLHSPLLPGPWRKRLDDLAATHGFRSIAIGPEEDIGERCRAIVAELAEALPGDDARIASVRFDDDDALAVDFVGRLLARAAFAAHGDVISFASGFTLHLVDGRPPRFHPSHAPLNAMGLSLISADPSAPATIWDAGNHARTARERPVTLMPDPGMYVCTSHIHNDSLRFSRRSGRKSRPLADAASILAERFDIDAEALGDATP